MSEHSSSARSHTVMSGSVASRQSGARTTRRTGGGTSKRSKKSSHMGGAGRSARSGTRSPASSQGNKSQIKVASSSSAAKRNMMTTDSALPQKLNGIHYDLLMRTYTAQINFATNRFQLHSSILNAVYFCMRIFDYTISLANECASAHYLNETESIMMKEEETRKKNITAKAADTDADGGGGGESEDGRKKETAEAIVATTIKRIRKPFHFTKDFAVYIQRFKAKIPPKNAPKEDGEVEDEQVDETTQLKHDVLTKNVSFAGSEFSGVLKVIENGLGGLCERMGTHPDDYVWAGCPGMFKRPILTFYSLISLEKELERYGYLNHIFPCLDLHQVLINSCWGEEIIEFTLANMSRTPEQESKNTAYEIQCRKEAETRKTILKETMDVLVGMKRTRLSHASKMYKVSQEHWAQVRPWLYKQLPTQFALFEDLAREAETSRNTQDKGEWEIECKRIVEEEQKNREEGDPTVDPPIRPDINIEFIKSWGDGESHEALAWRCSTGLEIRIHDLWLLLAEECLSFGEYGTASQLISQGWKHARAFACSRSLREAVILRMRLDAAEGRAHSVLSNAVCLSKKVGSAEVDTFGRLTSLAKNCYIQVGQNTGIIEDFLHEGLSAIDEVQKRSYKMEGDEIVIAEKSGGGGGGRGTALNTPGNSPSRGNAESKVRFSGQNSPAPSGHGSPNRNTAMVVDKKTSVNAGGSSHGGGGGGNREKKTEKRKREMTYVMKKSGLTGQLLDLKIDLQFDKIKAIPVSSVDFWLNVDQLICTESDLLKQLSTSGLSLRTVQSAVNFVKKFEREILYNMIYKTHEPGVITSKAMLEVKTSLLKILGEALQAKNDMLFQLATSHDEYSTQTVGSNLFELLLGYDMLVCRNEREVRDIQAVYQQEVAEENAANTTLAVAKQASNVNPGTVATSSSATLSKSKAVKMSNLTFQPPSREKRGEKPPDPLDPTAIYVEASKKKTTTMLEDYLSELDEQITTIETRKKVPKVATPLDKAVCELSSGMAVYRTGESTTPDAEHFTGNLASAELELGALFIDRASKQLDDAGRRWIGAENSRRDFETRAMEKEEKMSLIREGRMNLDAASGEYKYVNESHIIPNDFLEKQQKEKEEAEAAAAAKAAAENGGEGGIVANTEENSRAKKAKLEEAKRLKDREEGLEFEGIGVSYLALLVEKCLKYHHFRTGWKACLMLIEKIYGAEKKYSAHSFHYMSLYQLFRSLEFGCNTLFEATCTPDHIERVLENQITDIKERFSRPKLIESYSDLNKQIHQHPVYDLLYTLAHLMPPQTDTLIKNTLPAGTLYLTLSQVEDTMYVSAACSPSNPSITTIQYLSFKVPVKISSLWVRCNRLAELYGLLEKDLLVNTNYFDRLKNESLKEHEKIMEEIDNFFEPIMVRLEQEFWLLGRHNTLPNMIPRNLCLLLDSFLYQLPIEHLDCVQGLFRGCKPNGEETFISRDISLHILGTRTTRSLSQQLNPTVVPVVPAGSEKMAEHEKVLSFNCPIINKDALKAVVDPSAEDSVAGDDITSGLPLSKFFDGFFTTPIAKAVVGTHDAANNIELLVSVEDIINSIRLGNNFTFFGLSKLLVSMNPQDLGRLDLRNIDGMFMFCRAMNDKSFRRQKAKNSDIMFVNTEETYPVSVLATLRGVKSLVTTRGPVTVPFLQRVAAEFHNNVFEGNTTISKGLYDTLYKGRYNKDGIPHNLQDMLPDHKDDFLQTQDIKLARRPPDHIPSIKEERIWYSRYYREAFIAEGLTWACVGNGKGIYGEGGAAEPAKKK